MPIFVLTNRKIMMPGRGRPVNGGSIEEVLKSVRDAVGPNELKNLYVDGGETIRQFMDAGLLSTLCLSRFLKVELGRGVPLLEKKGSDMLSAMKPAYKVRERERERGAYNLDLLCKMSYPNNNIFVSFLVVFKGLRRGAGTGNVRF